MKGMPHHQRPVSARTRQQQQSRLWSIVLLLLFLGPLAVISGALLCALARAAKKQRAVAWLALAGVVGLILLALHWQSLAAELLLLRDTATPLFHLLRPTQRQPISFAQLRLLGARVWPMLWLLWRQAILVAPLVASYIHASKVKTAEELERERTARQERQQRAALRKAASKSVRAPAAAGGSLVLGVPIRGDLDWQHGGFFTYPARVLGRHLVLIGGSGSGKTETCKRLAYGAAHVYGWRVFYLDCKGDEQTAQEFLDAMRAAGRTRLARFPNDAFDGWRGDATALLNRLMMILDFSEPYYRDLTRMLLSLALEAPPGPPRSSAELLERLNLDELGRRYAGKPEARELAGLRAADVQAVYNRYRAFFKALRGGLDGRWAFEDVEAGYILLNGLALKDQTASLGRYVLEDFAHFVAARKAAGEQVLLIVDEFPAIAFGGANAATLFEMVRFHGASMVVTAQSYAGMGSEADRILGAAAGLILHQCADPEPLLPRAGQNLTFQRRISFTERGMGQAVREYPVGEGMLAQTEELKVDPNAVKQLDQGECVVISGGRAEQILVSQIRVPDRTSAPLPSTPRTTIVEIHTSMLHERRRRTIPMTTPRPWDVMGHPTSEMSDRATPRQPATPPSDDSIHEY